ncbi:IS1/IS1595 family N-terminal zinc-binding domain-containing protein [Anabaena sp. WFMT]|uniref:IS1/IS1595 family N-terminal zinc-binding domain-containing protein n=1 Tax=Anabaena sp. WFMT TaxID=3449730 RepID=UPI003F2522CE
MNFQTLRNGFVVGSLGVSFGGFIALFTPYKQFSQFFIASGLGSLASSSLAIQQSEKINKRKSKKFLTEIETLKNDTEHFSKLLQTKHQELTQIAIDRDNLAKLNIDLVETLEQLRTELSDTKTALQDTRDINIDSAVTTLRESLEEAVKQVNALVPFLVKKYPDVRTNCQELAAQFNEDVKLMSAQIGVISDNGNLTNEELIAACLAVQHEIILKGSSIKAKLYKAACDHLQRQLYGVIPFEEHSQKLETIKLFYQGNIKALTNEMSEVCGDVVTAYKTDFAETVQEGMQQVTEIQQLQNEVINLQAKLKDLGKPLQFVGTSEAARVGNSVVNYYHLKLGITLDALDFNSTETGYKLLFHLSRNNRFIDTATLNDGNNSDKIKELSGSLNSPKFSQSERSNYVSLDIELRKPEKKQATIEDIRRLIEPSAKFGEVVSRYHESKPTLRVMTRTGGGKGIAVKNLLNHYINHWENWELWLSDPQHGSFEDYWNCPKIAKSPTEASKVLELFIDEFNDRKNNESFNPDIPVMLIQDECDKTFDKKQKGGIAQVWTEIRHRKMKLCLIGQSSEVGKQGWTWDEMNNCSLMFIGDAIGTAIKHADDMGWSSEMKTKIPSIYQKVSEFFNSVNADILIKNQYRFALLIDGMRFDFVEIPPALEGGIDNNKSWLVSSPWQSKAIKEGQEVACTSCGSTAVKRNGKAGDKQRYKCSDCGKGFVV